tara:strand:- start:99 stop:461 length:363 start_codon:yes stop_codon:yes gene_type:complete
MAHGIMNDMAGERFDVFSAGISPRNVHPAAIEVMREIGIDISHYKSNHIEDYINKDINFVITVCNNANSNCPIFAGDLIREHWSIDDPFRNWSFNKKDLEVFRNTRNVINEKISDFLINI